jgi:hypothetical protein
MDCLPLLLWILGLISVQRVLILVRRGVGGGQRLVGGGLVLLASGAGRTWLR